MQWSWQRALSLVIGVWHVALAPLAADAPSEPGSLAYEEAIRHAVEEYSLGHWAEAKFFFARAHAANPNARTLRGLGLTCYESRSYVEAIGYFERALHDTNQPLTAAMRSDIAQLLTQAKQFVTRVRVELTPSTATLAVDRQPRQLDSERVLLLDPGEHELSAQAPGYEAQRRNVNAEGGELGVRFDLSASLAPAAVARGPASVRVQTPAAERGRSIAPWVVAGVSGAALVAGVVLVGIATSDKASVEHASDGASWSDLQGRYARARTLFPVSFALMGVGLAGVATGLAWELWPASGERASQARLRVHAGAVDVTGQF